MVPGKPPVLDVMALPPGAEFEPLNETIGRQRKKRKSIADEDEALGSR